MEDQFLFPSNGPSRKVKHRALISREKLFGIMVAFVVFTSISFLSLRWLESSITFHPERYVEGAAWSIPASAREVWFTTADSVRLNGWWFEPREPALATVIYFHGNGGNITNVAWVGENLAARGFQVLLFDYRGYGRSEGKIRDEQDIYLDGDAAYEFVTANTGGKSLVLYGQSLGTSVATDLAERQPCRALILESGFTAASDVASDVLPWFPRAFHFLLRNRFESGRKLKNVKSPVLITHGDPDPVIPTSHGRNLFAAANEPKKLVIFPGAGHNVFGSIGGAYLDQISEFIRASMKAN